jgi:hypothetical protein
MGLFRWTMELAGELVSAPFSNGERYVSIDELNGVYEDAGQQPDGTQLIRLKGTAPRPQTLTQIEEPKKRGLFR